MDHSIEQHIPVLSEALAEHISLPQDAVMVDATVGHGGHSLLFGGKLGPEGAIIGLDVDPNAIRRAQCILNDLPCKVTLVNSNFSQIAHVLGEHHIDKVDFILADLGFCSGQLDDPQIGLSFQQNMPLDMRMDKSIQTTAADIVNKADEKSLADLIFKYGEDRASRRIARAIAWHRQKEEITTTGQLANIICRATARPGARPRIHPATRTFQALRIAVNNELENLEALLNAAADLLKIAGYIAVISFHSLEDRIVKNNFRQNAEKETYRIITKKPLTADRNEIHRNRRARSAKLRMAQKT